MMRHSGSIGIVSRIALGDFRLTWKEKSVIVFTFLMPAAFMFVFGQMQRGSSPTSVRARLTIEDNDRGRLSESLISALSREDLSLVDADSLGAGDARVRTLVIPEGFSRKVLSRERTGLLLRKEEGSDQQAGQAVEVAIFRGLVKTVTALIEVETSLVSEGSPHISIVGDSLYGNLQIVIDNQPGAESLVMSRLDTIMSRDEIIKVESVLAGKGREIPSGYQSSVPGNLVMFVLMGMMFSGMGIAEERRSGVLCRIGMAPVSRGEIVAGKLFGRMMVAALQIFVLLVFGRIAFGISLGNDVPALVILMLAFAYCCGSFGVLFGSLFTNPDQITGLAVVTALVMSALGGCWWPLEVVSKYVRLLAFCLPTGWTMDGIHKLISFGYGFSSVILHITVLFLFGTVFLSFASKKLRWDGR